jgi:ribosome-associated protein
MNSRQLALRCARLAHERKAADLAILDMRKLTTFTDFFVVCSTESERQSKAIAEALRDTLKPLGVRAVGISGADSGQWVLADFSDVICHIFLKSVRKFYDLESLWSEAPRIPFRTRA